MGTTKTWKSRFGDGGTADGLPDGNHDAGSSCGMNDQYAVGESQEFWAKAWNKAMDDN